MADFLRAKIWTIIGVLGLLLFFTSRPVLAQNVLPPDQPEQDACNALVLCGNSFTTPYSYQGTGQVADLSTTPCGGGEGNSMWMRLTVNTAGIIVFTIEPLVSTDDYDFAVLDITNTPCDSITSANVIRCNFDNNYPGTNLNGIVGLNTTSTQANVGSGAYGPSFCQQITANAGDVYLIMINNFGFYTGVGGPSSGFTIDFTGSTATFNQPVPPHFLSVVPKCDNTDSIKIALSTNVLCSSIATDGSDFYLTPTGTVIGAHGLNCLGTAGYTDTITVVFNSLTVNGDYYLRAKTGSDGNTLMNFCDAALPLPDSLKFHVGDDPIPLVGLDTPACQTLTVKLAAPVSCNSIAADGSDFSVTGPSSVTVNSAAGVGCTGDYTQTIAVHLSAPIAVDGDYTISFKDGSDGNTVVDSCSRYVLVGASLPFHINSYNGLLIAHPDTSMCPGVITLYPENHGTAPAGGFQYSWSSSSGMSYPNQTSPSVTVDTGYNRYIAATVDQNGCYMRDSVVVTGFAAPHAQFSYDIGPGCQGDTVFFHNESSTANRYLWKFGLANLNDTLENTQFVYPDQGTYSVTLIAQNDNCTDSAMSLVHVGHPMSAGFIVSNDTICQGTQITFTNQSTMTAVGSQGGQYQWSFGDGTTSNLANPPSYTYNNTGTYPVRLVINDSIPCYDTATHLIVVDSVSGLSINVSDTPICQGDKILFNAVYSDNGMVYARWNFGDGPDSVLDQNLVSHAYEQAGIYTVSLYNHYRVCPDTGLSFRVRIKDMPVINLGADTSLCLDGDPLEIKDGINASDPAATWLWNTGDTTSSIDIKHPGLYWAKVTIDYCSATDEITVNKDCYMDVPNSFTPNDDGSNDYFFPRQKLASGIAAFKMSVFNRWGQKMFETTNVNGRGWDGRFNDKEQPVGVYVYLIDVVYKNGRTESYKGNVTLLR
ncbi:MAG TPA: PKD domain-containing protein [Edaphocola sp.]|nr:PKD domain-containing protein [Edaphocola sp.]